MAQQRIEHRKPVVDARPGKPQRQNERGRDGPQGLVEIGRLLFGDHVLAAGGNPVPARGRQRIEIPDHRNRQVARRQCPVCAAVRGDQNRCPAQRHPQHPGPHRTTPDQGHTIR